jgi:hypothetical protein
MKKDTNRGFFLRSQSPVSHTVVLLVVQSTEAIPWFFNFSTWPSFPSKLYLGFLQLYLCSDNDSTCARTPNSWTRVDWQRHTKAQTMLRHDSILRYIRYYSTDDHLHHHEFSPRPWVLEGVVIGWTSVYISICSHTALAIIHWNTRWHNFPSRSERFFDITSPPLSTAPLAYSSVAIVSKTSRELTMSRKYEHWLE